MTFITRIQNFAANQLAGRLDLIVAALCLIPTLGFLMAWHMQVDLKLFTAFVTVPALIALMACEVWMVNKAPELFNRVASGLVGGVVATLALDALRVPAAYLLKGAPDYVPMVGQNLMHEMVGIAPSLKAVVLGYGYHYLLMGALLGAAYALVAGRVRRSWSLPAGLVAGVAFAFLPQFQMLAVATGFSLPVAMAIVAVGFGLAGAALGLVVDGGRRRARVMQVTFLPELAVESK